MVTFKLLKQDLDVSKGLVLNILEDTRVQGNQSCL